MKALSWTAALELGTTIACIVCELLRSPMNNIDILDGTLDEHACGPRTLGGEKKTEQLWGIGAHFSLTLSTPLLAPPASERE
jgi:hypothetical protein